LISFIALAVMSMLMITAAFPGIALAGGIGDVVTEVTNANFSSANFNFGTESATGLSIKMHMGGGDIGNGYGGVTVLGPTDAAGMQTMLDYVDSQSNHTSIDTQKMKGCEVRKYTMADGAGVGVLLPDYFVTVELYETGNGNAADIQTALNIAQQTLDGLERAGLLSQAAPDIQAEVPAETEEVPANGAVVTAEPLDEPVRIADTTNIAGVYNGPTVPTTFSINGPHLVTEIHDYHWNNAQGATPGTIGLQDQNGTIYGPWQAVGTPGQGGVPDANWYVYPNIVIPAGTYTVIDSDPSTWAQNEGSGGKGMGYVLATPHFETTSGSVDDLTSPGPGGTGTAEGHHSHSPAGVGSVGNIPGPSTTTEAVVGVAVPGLIATALGALGGLGGGGLVPPAGGTPIYPNGTGPLNGAGGIPGAGSRSAGMAQATSQIGRRGKEEILIDTTDMFENQTPVQEDGIIIDTIHDKDLLIDAVEEEGIIIDTIHDKELIDENGMIVDGAGEAGVFVSPDSDILIDTAAEGPGLIQPGADGLADGTGGEILIDTSAMEGSALADHNAAPSGGAEETSSAAGTEKEELIEEGPYDREGFDKEGFDKEGFDRQGFDREGFNKAGFDAQGYDREGFDQAGFDAEGFDREGFDHAGLDRGGFNKDGFDQNGFDKEGFNKAGLDAEGYNKEGFNQAGFDREGYNREGFDQSGFDREGINKEGFDQNGFDKDGYNKAGFDARGYDKEGFDQAGLDQEGFGRDGFDQTGFDREGFNKDGFDKNGFDKEGFNKARFDAEGYNKEGFDQAGFDREGFNKDGFDHEGFNKEGLDQNGFDKEGFNREGYDKLGYDRQGFNKQGFDKAGYDREGFGRNGYDAEGYNRQGLDVNGNDRNGYNRSGFDAEGYDKAGYDREGFNKAGLNKDGFDREGFDKNGFDKDGYDREGLNKEGRQRDGKDEYGYEKDGFNEDGFDKDGYDRQGFDYEGYNRDGYDPWGYNKQGYGKDGYHWSGYNADGYDKSGRHWSENPYKDSPFDVTSVEQKNPFTSDSEVRISVEVELDENGNVIGGRNLADTWKPTKPPLGEPYPKTAEKYGPKAWTDEIPKPETEKPTAPAAEGSGVIGPEDPMNTLKNHDLGGQTQTAPEGQSGSGLSIPEEDIPETGDIPQAGDIPQTGDIPDAGDIPQEPIPDVPPVSGPKHGDTITLPGKDGRDYVLDYNEKTGEWENILTGGKVRNEDLDSYIKDFNKWQDKVAEDQKWSAADLEKMAKRQDANSKAIDEALGKWKNLENMQKAADKYDIGEKGGPGDMDKAIQDLKDDMLAGKEVDEDRMEQLKKIIGNRIEGKTTGDTGKRWEEEPWYKDLDSALKANAATAKEVITGEKEDGSTSWLGMGARAAIGAATGGASESVFTVAEAMQRIKTSVDSGKDGVEAYTDAIKQLLLEEAGGELLGAAGGKVSKLVADTFPNLSKSASEAVERNLLKIMKADQLASRGLGMVGAESAENAIKQIEKRLTELGGDAAGEAAEKAAKAAKRTIAGGSDEATGAAGKAAKGSADDIAGGTGRAAAGSSDEIADSVRKGGIDPDAPKGTRGAGGSDSADIPGKKAAGTADEAADAAAKKGADAADEAADAAGKKIPDEGLNKNARSDAEVFNDPEALGKAEQSLKGKMKDFDNLPDAKKQQLINDQAKYDEYQLQAEGRNWELADKVSRGEPVSVKDVLDMKSDPASMRKLKDIDQIGGLGGELGDRGAKNVQMKFNETLKNKVYDPSYEDVTKSLKGKYGEVKVETIRTPGKEYQPWDINTDNDIVAKYKVVGPDGKVEWKEIPRSEWEDTYFKSYAKNTGFDPQDAAKKFPNEDWSKMSQAEQYRKWGELHGESPTDVYHPEGARDFSTERTSILNGQAPDKAAAAQAAKGQGTLLDSEGLGMMEKNKIDHYWGKGDLKSQTEAMEQLRKASAQAQKLENGYKSMGYKVSDMPDNMQEAIKAVNDNSLSPASRAARLAELGYDSPGDFVDKLTSRIGALKAARK